MILFGYAITAPLILVVLAILRNRRVSSSGRFLSSLSVAHAALYIALTVYALVGADLPSYYLPGQYFFIDRLGAYEVLIASFIFLLATLYARGYVRSLLRAGEISPDNLQLFYVCLNLLLAVVAFAFYSNNLALYWIFLEVTTVISSVLIVTLNAKDNIVAALKYVFIASTAMLFSFIGLILLFAMSRQVLGEGTLNWNLLMEQAKALPSSLFSLAFVFLFIGFGAKSGIVPFHTWLPPAHAKAPSVVSALLSAVLLNIGTYGILRLFAIGHQTAGATMDSILLIGFGVLTIGIASLSMLARENVKKLIAFSSVEHMGLILLGIGLGSALSVFWVLFYVLAHSLTKCLLFLSAGILNRQYGGNRIEQIRNALVLQPLATWGVIIGSVAIIGTPLFPVFVPKLMILLDLGDYSLPLLAAVLLFLLIAAASLAVFFVHSFTQRDPSGLVRPHAAPWTMKAPVIVLLVLICVFGLYQPPALMGTLSSIVASLGF